jgi:3'(2'), 5'-bisphosphate nucleotidase
MRPLLLSRSWKHFLILLASVVTRCPLTDVSVIGTFAFCLDTSVIDTRSHSSSSRLPAAASTAISDENDFDPQIQVALKAVRKACVITSSLQDTMDYVDGTITKSDESPVTVADFASQAVILKHLKQHFPNDLYLAEERSDNLTPEATILIRDASGIDDEKELKECIDLGQSFFEVGSDSTERGRVWCLDPIDGTKGFLRKGQYCVALGLLKDGVPQIGILACPNLPSSATDESNIGCIFLAILGQGCYELPINPGSHPLIQLPLENKKTINDATKARFCVGVEQGFADPVGRCKATAAKLHGGLDPNDEIIHSIRMDSQAKYGVVARGDAEFYVRLPKSEHLDWIWDVAPGVLVLQEIGGYISDAKGKPLDFSSGAKLTANGILGAATPELHKALLDAYNSCGEGTSTVE